MIKRILKEVKEYKLASFLAPLFMVGEVLLEIALPFLMSFSKCFFMAASW